MNDFEKAQAAKISSFYSNGIQKSEEDDLEKGGAGSGRRKVNEEIHYEKHGKKHSGKILSETPSGRYNVESSDETGKIQHMVHENEITKSENDI